MRSFHEVSGRLLQIYAQALQESNRGRYHEELWSYYGNLAMPQGCQTRVRFVYDFCRLARFNPEGKAILDAGCGFGAVAIILKLMGAKEVHGVDIADARLLTFQQMIHDFRLNDIQAHRSSVDDVPYPDRFFDMVLSNEAISHYSDVDAFLRESARVLKPGGVLIIVDGNNGANPRTRKSTVQLWERYENGPAGEFEGHLVQTPYVEMRAMMVREAAPELSEATVLEIARATSGMIYPEIVHQVEQYLKTGRFPNSYYQRGRCPRNPQSGAVMEQLFHPAELASHVERFGFRARYYAHFGGSSGNPLVRLINAVARPLTPITVRWARGFRIVAWRQ